MKKPKEGSKKEERGESKKVEAMEMKQMKGKMSMPFKKKAGRGR